MESFFVLMESSGNGADYRYQVIQKWRGTPTPMIQKGAQAWCNLHHSGVWGVKRSLIRPSQMAKPKSDKDTVKTEVTYR